MQDVLRDIRRAIDRSRDMSTPILEAREDYRRHVEVLASLRVDT